MQLLDLSTVVSQESNCGSGYVNVVSATGNQPPTVTLGADGATVYNTPTLITPVITDDGLPNGGVSLVWAVLSGPGSASLVDAGAGALSASFGAVGTYVLRLTVDDGEFSASDEVAFTVTGGANAAPTVALTAPAAGATAGVGTLVNIAATAADARGQ